MPDALQRLKRRLMVAYEFAIPDQRTLADGIYQQRAEIWRQTLTNEARTAGSARTGRGPNGIDRDELRRMSNEDAASIAQTFNKDLESQIEQLYRANPDGGRQYYVQALTRWADQRAAWKDRQIANQNRATAQSYAQQRFNVENKVGDALYVFAGPPPREIHCADHFAAGVVDQEYVDANPTPIHINCPHQWRRIQSTIGVTLDNIWTGA